MTETIRSPCSHTPEPHVIYDMPASGYRGEVRCRCRKIRLVSARVRERVAEAEADARLMLTAKPKPASRPGASGRRIVGAQTGIYSTRPNPPPKAPTRQEIDAAWIGWWKGIMARQGYESRL